MTNFYVVRYQRGLFDAIMSGMGRNKGTQDYLHSEQVAKRYARSLNRDPESQRAGYFYAAETDSAREG